MINEYMRPSKVENLRKVSIGMVFIILGSILVIYLYNLYLTGAILTQTIQVIFNISVPCAVAVAVCYFEDKISNKWKYLVVIYLIVATYINFFQAHYFDDPSHLWAISYCAVPLIGQIMTVFNVIESFLVLTKKYLKVLDLICLLDFIIGVGGVVYFVYSGSFIYTAHYLLSHIPFAFMFLFAYPDEGLTDIFCYDSVISNLLLRLFGVISLGIPLITILASIILKSIVDLSLFALYTLIFCGVIIVVWIFILVYARELNEEDAEKTVLVKEVHHRVKNNLQTITSLISLEERFETDPNKILDITKTRINALALIHETVYNESDMNYISIKEFFSEFDDTLRVLSTFPDIKFKSDIDDEELYIDYVTPLVLMTNELTTNSFKYAFEESDENKLIEKSISLYVDIRGIKMCKYTYKDYGKGLPDDFDKNSNGSLGWTIIKSLVSQLDGEYEVFNDNGFNFILTFPVLVE